MKNPRKLNKKIRHKLISEHLRQYSACTVIDKALKAGVLKNSVPNWEIVNCPGCLRFKALYAGF